MGDARNTGRRDEGRAGWGGQDRQRPRRDFGEHWLEHMIGALYQSVIDEPVPKPLLDIVRRLPQSRPSAARRATDPLERARKWRAKAEEVETAAESMRDHSARQALLQLASSYRTLAQFDESLAQRLGSQKRDAG